jgi:hypothetical protein
MSRVCMANKSNPHMGYVEQRTCGAEDMCDGCWLTLLIFPYSLNNYSSAGNITTILAYQEVTNWSVHKFEARCRPGTTWNWHLLLTGPSVSAQFLPAKCMHFALGNCDKTSYSAKVTQSVRVQLRVKVETFCSPPYEDRLRGLPGRLSVLWISRALSLEEKHLSCEADHSSPSGECLKVYSTSPCLYGQTKLHGLSPRVNYTDRATAACRRSDCQLLRIKGATWSAWRIPTAVFSVF